MKYNVHVYMVYRARFDGIEAASQLEAIRIADTFDVNEADNFESAEEVTDYLVDEVDDDGFQNSCFYKPKDRLDA